MIGIAAFLVIVVCLAWLFKNFPRFGRAMKYLSLFLLGLFGGTAFAAMGGSHHPSDVGLFLSVALPGMYAAKRFLDKRNAKAAL
ncbi:hypothetical protein IAG25_15645 [Caballeronia sp. EK]|uniref:hypothetical protein n=1 Tax=Caballeronia sp. EK TaxID=2767469 RepID=UPI00165659AD|nr:hypothetical protein [Caballeronia sp. EK]MBC8638255.1 hypothetical protein [Caballeronia sp. EK]